jgi:transposase InsO family protein
LISLHRRINLRLRTTLNLDDDILQVTKILACGSSFRAGVGERESAMTELLERAVAQMKREIFNTDQGAQFTTTRFTRPLLDKGSGVSVDGCGQASDNIVVERLWRTVKSELRLFAGNTNCPGSMIGIARLLSTFYSSTLLP